MQETESITRILCSSGAKIECLGHLVPSYENVVNVLVVFSVGERTENNNQASIL